MNKKILIIAILIVAGFFVGYFLLTEADVEHPENGDEEFEEREEVEEEDEFDMDAESEEEEYEEEGEESEEDIPLPVSFDRPADETVSLDEGVQLAQNWIELHSVTYRERSERGGLNLIDTREVDNGQYEIIFEFQATYDGFGPIDDDSELVEVDEIREVVAYMHYNRLLAVVIDEAYEDRNHDEVDADFQPFDLIDYEIEE